MALPSFTFNMSHPNEIMFHVGNTRRVYTASLKGENESKAHTYRTMQLLICSKKNIWILQPNIFHCKQRQRKLKRNYVTTLLIEQRNAWVYFSHLSYNEINWTECLELATKIHQNSYDENICQDKSELEFKYVYLFIHVFIFEVDRMRNVYWSGNIFGS